MVKIVNYVFLCRLIIVTDRTKQYDVETAEPKPPKGPVVEKNLVIRTDSNWLYDEENNNRMRLSTILLSAMNFSIEVPLIERTLSTKSSRRSHKEEEVPDSLKTIQEESSSREGSCERDTVAQVSLENNITNT